MSKYIFVTGGVCSSLGKGVAASSIGSILESRGLTVRMMKADPYLNLNAGLMDPLEHGEVYVTADGAETDLDLGNYARFTSAPISQKNSLTTGQIYDTVIKKTRNGGYNGVCVQVVPHLTNEIKNRIYSLGNEEGVDVVIVEVGGTVGDIESIPYLETIRQIIHELGPKNALSVHLALMPIVSCGEVKTKPAQHSVKSMREIGIQPQILICRCQDEMIDEQKRKIALYTNIDHDAVISGHDCHYTIYEIPLSYHQQKLDEVILSKLELKAGESDLSAWQKVVDSAKNAKMTLNVAMVGKYAQLDDAYKSTDEAIIHAALANDVKVKIHKVNSNEISSETNLKALLGEMDAVICPTGEDEAGSFGIIKATEYARINKVPFLAVSFGLHLMALEFAKNVCKMQNAGSTEFNEKTEAPIVIKIQDEAITPTLYGNNTLRLGNAEANLVAGSKIAAAYSKEISVERHRHNYQINKVYQDDLAKAGMVVTAKSCDVHDIIEAMEWQDHPWGVGVECNPEYTSQPVKANPLFKAFMKAAIDYRNR